MTKEENITEAKMLTSEKEQMMINRRKTNTFDVERYNFITKRLDVLREIWHSHREWTFIY